MPGMTMIRLPHTGYYLTIMRIETPRGKGNEKTVLVSYTILNHVLKNGKLPTTALLRISKTT